MNARRCEAWYVREGEAAVNGAPEIKKQSKTKH
jgi:hypothetical protein